MAKLLETGIFFGWMGIRGVFNCPKTGAMPSTVIAHFNYHAETKTLEIRFVSGAVYNYHDVPEAIYRQFKTASSKGTYFNQHIKDIYPFERKA